MKSLYLAAFFALITIAAGECTSPTNCKTCAVSGTCTECNANYFLKGTGASATCVTTCGDGQFGNGAATPPACVNCADTGCKTCGGIASNTCQQCNTNLFFKNLNNAITCPDAATCTGAPASGAAQYYTNSTTNCTTACPAGTFANADKACTACPTGCATCVSAANCTTTNYGYFLNVNTVTACGADCSNCTNATACTNCTGMTTKANTLIRNGTCVAACGDGFFNTTPAACTMCPANCTTCTATNCTACATGITLMEGKCFGFKTGAGLTLGAIVSVALFSLLF